MCGGGLVLKVTRYINGIKVDGTNLASLEIESEAAAKAIRAVGERLGGLGKLPPKGS